MRRVAVLLAVIAAALLMASGVALAVNKSGGNGDDRIIGTDGRDRLSGGQGDDLIRARGAEDQVYGDSGEDELFGGDGPDNIFGGRGPDDVFGGGGDDFINVLDERGNDEVECGPGDGDEVYVDPGDTFSGDCENFAEIEIVPANAGTLSSQELSALPTATVVE